MEFRELTFGSPDYERALVLRKKVLRDPLGVEWTDEERAWEPRERHFALVAEGVVCAVVVARDLGEGRVKFRQMAVAPEKRGSGRGRELLESAEALLNREGVEEFELNARDVAVGFYERMGYRRVGEEFVEVGISHWKMVKTPADL